MKKIFRLLKQSFLGLKNNKGEVLSLLRLSVSFIQHPKEGFSIVYHSIKSLNSVYGYKKMGKKTLDVKKESLNINKSKKVYILGSGPSVNSITENEWRDIRENDSWGFNVWFPHHFVPTVYFAQSFPKGNERIKYLNKEMKAMLKDREEEYKDVKFYVRGAAANDGVFYKNPFGEYLETNFNVNLYHLAELSIPSYSSIAPGVLYKKMMKVGFFEKKQSTQCIPKLGSTVGELISFALILGYKEIVLCGIDMNDGGHFYDEETYFNKYPFLREMYKINHSYKDGNHEHMDKSKRPYTIKEYIVELNKFAKNHFDAEVFVINESTVLFPEINNYKV